MFSRFAQMSSWSTPFCVGQITPYGLLPDTDCHGLMELYMEQMTHQVTDAVSLLSHLSNTISSTILNEIYVFLEAEVDYRIHYIRNKLQLRGWRTEVRITAANDNNKPSVGLYAFLGF
jgi:hypothetical protein